MPPISKKASILLSMILSVLFEGILLGVGIFLPFSVFRKNTYLDVVSRDFPKFFKNVVHTPPILLGPSEALREEERPACPIYNKEKAY